MRRNRASARRSLSASRRIQLDASRWLTLMPFPPHLVDAQAQPVPDPSADTVVELVAVGPFDVEGPEQIRFRFRRQPHRLHFAEGYSRWRMV